MTLLKFRTSFLPLLFILLSIYALHQCSAVIYTDQFVIHVKGGRAVAEALANKHGYTYLGEILDGYHHLQHHKITKRAIKPSIHDSIKLSEEPEVTWFKQQTLKKRVKRDSRRVVRIPEVTFIDPLWPKMWYLNRGKELDMNIEGVWKQGISGRGVVVTILDDGLEKDHPDIAQNYDPNASFDVNNHDENPEPRYDAIDSNRHGTRCAGEVAAIANNSFCAVGVAFEASVGGVRMLDGDVTDAVEAQSLSLNPNHIDIYSASWGPDDDGKTVDGPGELATKAFKEGVENGRNGLGSIFVWASGNGGREHDNCNCDGYTNSIWTLSISSATENGLVPWYSEACSSTLATTYSSGSSVERQIVTTDLHHKCTLAHTGTSASAPLAAGICALALQANKKLTWRDMQHIVVRTARPDNLFAKDWKVNGVGRNVSHSFGYGLMDATAMVNLARNWVTVPEQKVCDIRAESSDKVIPAKSHVTLSLTVHCEHVNFLEHVQSKITLTTAKRGDVHIYLTSPMGTRSKLLAIRPMDSSRSGFIAWPFMTVHTWGENPNGVWYLEVHNEARYYASNHPPYSILGRAYLKEWSLIMYGTLESPDRHASTTSAPPPTTSPIVTQGIPITQSPPPSKFHYVPPPPVPPYNPSKTSRPTTYVFSNNNALGEEPADMPSDNNKLGPNSKLEESAHSSSAQSVLHDGSKSSVPCAHQSRKGLCLDCPEGSHLLNGLCYTVCPANHFEFQSESVQQVLANKRKREENENHHHKEVTPNRVDTNISISSISVCRPCHYSCQSCRGPGDDECLTCHLDSNWMKGHCFPQVVLDKLDEEEVRNRSLMILAIILCPTTIFLAVLAFYTCFLRKRQENSSFVGKADYLSVPAKDRIPNGATNQRLLSNGGDNLESEDEY